MIHHHSSGKRRLWKRIFSMCIALVLICGLTVPASSVSASSKEEGTAGSAPAAVYEFFAAGSLYDSQTIEDGGTLTEPEAPTMEGKVFDGWYTSEEGGEKFTDFGPKTVTENVTVSLYAGWQEEENENSAEPNVTEEPSPDAEPVQTGQEETAESGTEPVKEPGNTVPEEDPDETISDEEPGKPDEPADIELEEDTEKTESGLPSNVDGVIEAPEENAGISTMSISGPRSVAVGESIELSSNQTGYSTRNHSWSAEPRDRVQLSNSSSASVSVTGLKEGTVTITHRYEYWSWFDWHSGSEQYHITVTEASQPDTYPLYAYTLIPGVEEGSSEQADNVWNGMGIGSISGVEDPTKLSVDKIIDNGYGDSGAVITYPNDAGYEHSIVLNGAPQRAESYPPIYSDGRTYQYAAPGSGNEDQEGYYTITWMRVIVANGANAGNNEFNDTVASKEDGGKYTYHLDGVVTLNEKNRYTVQFKLKDANADNFELVDPETYSTRVDAGYQADKLKRPDINEPVKYPQTKTVNGITYAFDGWYIDEACTQEVDWSTYTITQNTIFYARYVPASQSLVVEKKVTGNMGDVQKAFDFTYSYVDASGQTQTGNFSLKDGENKEICNIPVGVELTLEEKNAAGYTASYTYADNTITVQAEKNSSNRQMTITTVNGQNKIVVTNHKDAIPDTGVHLTAWPHIMTLAFVGVGAVTYGVYKSRKRGA